MPCFFRNLLKIKTLTEDGDEDLTAKQAHYLRGKDS